MQRKVVTISLNTHAKVEKFYQYAKNRVYSVSFQDILRKGKLVSWSGKKVLTDSGAMTYEEDYLNWKSHCYQTIPITHRRLLVISTQDNVFMVFLDQKIAVNMPCSGLKKSRFKMHNDYGDKFVYVLNGIDSDTNIFQNTCMRFDLQSHLWKTLPTMNNPCTQPGTVISKDKNYLFAFGDYFQHKFFCERLTIGRFFPNDAYK